MHPILRDWRRFLVWIAAWIPIGAILTVVARLSGHLRTDEAIAVMLPTTLVMSFVCLSPYYVCRSMPLRSAAKQKSVLNHLGAAFVLTGGVMLVGRFSASLLTPTFPGLDAGF